MRLLHRSGICILAFGAGLAALQVEPAIIRGMVFDNGAGRLSVGSVRVPLWSAAWAQAPDTLALENVRFTFGSTTYEAKRIEFSGVTSSRADIDALFSTAGSEPFAPRLARINARRIAIPELKLTQKLGPETTTGVYKNIVLTDIVQGRTAQTTAETAVIDVAEGKDRTSLTYGRMFIDELDLKALATIYETKAETESLTKIHGAFSIDDIGLIDGKGLKLKVGRLSGRDFMARPTKDSWSGTAAFLAEIGQKKKLNDEDQARLMPVVADMLSAFDLGFAEAAGIEMKIPPEAMKAKKGKVTEMTLKIGRIAYTSAAASQAADVRMEGFEIIDEDGRMAAATTSLTGFSFQSTLNAMRGVEIKTFDDLDAEILRAFVPTLGTLRITGLDLDVPKEDQEGKDKSKGKGKGKIKGTDTQPQRIKAQAADFELTADKPFNGIPTNIKIKLEGFNVPLDGFEDMLALGYKSFTLGTDLEANWNEATNEVAFSYAFDSQNMARTSISGLIGNVTKDAFNPDTNAAMIAAMDTRTKSMKVEIQNHGLVDVYLAQMAKEQKTTPEALRKNFSTMAGSVIPTILGESEQGKAVGQAVARFIDKPGRLTIDARSKDPAGLGILQIMAIANNPTALDQLNITAVAE